MMDAERKEAREEGGFNQMEIRILENNKDTGRLSFILKESTPVFANTLRRLMIDEVPTMAI